MAVINNGMDTLSALPAFWEGKPAITKMGQ